jgi:hypothetical protein
MSNFENRFLVLIARLNRIMGRQFTLKKQQALTPIEKALYSIWIHNRSGDTVKRDSEFERMVMLIHALLNAKKHKPELFSLFKRELNRTGASDSFFGIRFEITIMDMLISKSMSFNKTESPDFSIEHNGNKMFIECGSARLRKTIIGDFKYKVRSVIHEKSNKPYCASNTALFIDVTNLIYNSVFGEKAWTPNTLREIASNEIESTKYGSIALFCYLVNRDLGRYECVYIRVDSQNIDVGLYHLLNEIVPSGDHRIRHYVVPAEG